MSERRSLFSLLAYLVITAALVVAAIWGLSWVNETMTVRYQAIGRVVDSAGNPVSGVEAVLLLEPPPPAGPQLDALFRREGVANEHYGAEGLLKRAVGPTIGLSDYKGVYVVRATGRTGAARAIRMGMDSGGRPPFERAWLVLRTPAGRDEAKALSLLGWKTAPRDWGTFVNRLPRIVLD